jgi:hypothetical protein
MSCSEIEREDLAMPRRRKQDDEDPFAALGEGSVTPPPTLEEAEDDDDFPEPSPSRANVLAALAIADDETDLEMANYYVQRAIGESCLLLVDLLTSRQSPPSAS